MNAPTTVGYEVGWVHVRTGDGWVKVTDAQAIAMRPARSEAEWQRIEALEASVGRAHEKDTP